MLAPSALLLLLPPTHQQPHSGALIVSVYYILYFRMTLGLLKYPNVVHYERSIRLTDYLSPRSPPSREVKVKFYACAATQAQATSAAAIGGCNGPYDLHLLVIYPLDVLLRVSLHSCSRYFCALAIPFSATEIAYNAPTAAETPVVKKYQWAVP